MIAKVTLRNLSAHKVRLALTALAVMLGVSFVAGTLIFTQTLQNTFDTLFAQIGRGTDVVVRGQAAFQNQPGQPGQADRRLVPDRVLAQVRDVRGVAQLLPSVTGFAAVVGRDGKVVANTGPPTIGVAWHAIPDLSPLRLTSGRGPRTAGEVAIDTVTAAKAGYRPGDRVRILTRGPAQTMTLVGIFQFGSLGNLAGATLTAFDPATAQRRLLKPGYVSEIDVHASPGVSQAVLRARVQAILPAGFEAVTGAQVAKENATVVQQALKFLNTFLLVFGFLAVFVGAFIIFNTFSMLVAQRTRELALLRAVGASRAQVTRAVMGEALGVGVFAATAGLALGFGLAKLLQILLSAFGISLPTSGLGLDAQAVVWSYVVGIAVTLAAAYGPARRAGRIPPVAALRDDVAMPARSLRLRMVAGGVVTLAGAAAAAAGLARALSGASTAALTGAGAAVVFVGAAMLAPAVSRPVVRLLAAPFTRSVGAPGRLAKQNALRNPRRTAATASALMIGLALIGAVTVLNSSAQVSVDKAVASGFGADYVVTSRSFVPFGPEVTTTLANVPGVTAAVPLYVASARLAGKVRLVTAGDAAGIAHALRLSVVSGSASKDGILVPQSYADAYHLEPGAAALPVEFQDGATVTARVSGIYATSHIFNDVVLPTAMYRAHTTRLLVNDVFLTVENGAGTGVRKDLQTVLGGYPNLKLLDQTGLKQEAKGQIATLTNIVLALLLLAVIIAAIGIVNTLALSVVERTREIGLLRAVGMSRRQLRRMVRLEAIVISVFGALLGLALGLAFGAALRRSLASDGFTTLSIPVLQLAGYLAGAALLGMVAAVWPAWRASRLSVLSAIAVE
ncbi:MAG TPA: FtsX-like permease family protein [Streptosporangiaceae bacterium]|nr:FtsX-like permease family protein [Streptosporangiaceae bacterium]